ncbi:fungal-specific transcription factor domain-containing protein [Aspergillus keveii]|uniref:Fungal-specific transcription factor domain-containing protein n=1 Tax=Aspergillus keveii TaxID=714993 RepID=A0ABR4GR88_9EURO
MSSRRTPRASIACTKCRLRKVRCDVAYRGHPCVNCKLDQEECIVQLRGRQSRLRLEIGVPDQSSSNATSASASASASEPVSRSEKDTKPKAPRCPPRKKAAHPNSTSISSSTTATAATDIAFQAYPFIRSEFLSRLNQDEICYLDSQSCFRLPVASPWQGMLHAYFEHINPLVPVLDEASFWQTVRENGASSTLSLFVVQAILFAACPFASRRTIRECGFANCRKARAAFYRRAKLLYRLESELRPIEIIQGTLLLSLCSSAQTSSPVNSVWLSIAVQHARTLGVHHHQHTPVSQGTTLCPDWLELKRLWWVCLVRDRIIALAHRRPLQIAVNNWDAELELLSSQEVYEAMCRSEVHSAPARQGLFAVFEAVLRLCVPLTGILALGGASESGNGNGNGNAFLGLNLSLELDQTDACAEALRQWRDETKARFETCYRAGTPVDSIAMHDHLLQIYYHSAYLHILNSKIKAASTRQQHALHAQDALAGIGNAVETTIESIATSLSILAKRRLTQYIPNSIIMCAVPSVVLDAVYLKTTTTSTTTTTIPTQIPNAEQFTMHLQSKSNTARARIQTFYETTLALQTRYNNVHPVTDVITKVVDLLDGPNTYNSTSAAAEVPTSHLSASVYGSVYSCGGNGGTSIAMRMRHPRACWNWNDLVASQPRYYLAVLRALDLVLSTGRAPAGSLVLDDAGSEPGSRSGIMSKPARAPAPMSISVLISEGSALTPVPPLPTIGCSVANTNLDGYQCAEADMSIGPDADSGTEVDMFAKSPSIAIEPGPDTVVPTPLLLLQPPQPQPLQADPVLRDIFGLCRDLDIETLLIFAR